MSEIRALASADFGTLTGCPPHRLSAALAPLQLPRLDYTVLSAAERAAVFSEIEETVANRNLRIAGGDDPAVWERGWGELAERLGDGAVTLEALKPQYFHDAAPCRLFGDLVRPAAPDFEYCAGAAVRCAIFETFLCGWERIVELGCGTGLNLLLLARRFPEAKLIGSDWAAATRTIIARLAHQGTGTIEWRRFNMLTADGWEGREIDRGTAVLTVHALEQLGPSWEKLLAFLLARGPGLCVHVEPLYELYDPTRPLDELARRYHRKRNYLQGFVPRIEALARDARAEIVALRRVPFGGLYHEAYSILAWRPLMAR